MSQFRCRNILQRCQSSLVVHHSHLDLILRQSTSLGCLESLLLISLTKNHMSMFVVDFSGIMKQDFLASVVLVDIVSHVDFGMKSLRLDDNSSELEVFEQMGHELMMGCHMAMAVEDLVV